MTKIDRLARSTSDLYRIITALADKGASFKVVDDPSIDTTSRTGKLVMGILALIAEFACTPRRKARPTIPCVAGVSLPSGKVYGMTDEALYPSGDTLDEPFANLDEWIEHARDRWRQCREMKMAGEDLGEFGAAFSPALSVEMVEGELNVPVDIDA